MKFLQNIGKDAGDIGAGIAGGAVGRVITNKMGDKIPVIGSNPKLKPVGSFLLGLLVMGSSKGMVREVGRGMAIVAGTDALGNYVSMASAQGVNEDINGLADELADELEQRLNDDVNNANAAVNDDVSNGSAAVNDDINEDINEDINGDDDL